MSNTLVAPADLANLPGAPFTDETVDAAVARIRNEAGWHIAPSVAETVTVDGTSGRRLVLPSRMVTGVTEVRDTTNAASPHVLTGWRKLSSKSGCLERDGWPRGEHVIEVDLVHGYQDTPPELLPLVAALASVAASNIAAAREKAGPFEVEHTSAEELDGRLAAAWSALDPFRARIGF